MDEQKLMAQFAALLQENNAAIFEYMQGENSKIRQEIADSKNEVIAYVENTTNKRIDSLFDGYVSVRERQDAMQKELDEVRERLAQLELLVKSLAS